MILALRSSLRGFSLSSRVCALLLAIIAVVVVIAPLIEVIMGVKHDSPDLALRQCAASLAHPLGCDDVGQDVLLRLLFGGRVSLIVGFVAALLSTAFGAFIGIVAGMRGGLVDTLLMRLVDAMLAIPILPLLLLASAMAIGADATGTTGSALKLAFLLAMFGWMGVARVARAEAMRIAHLDYVVAARALGASSFRILAKHVLPNAAPALLVAATLDVGRNILAESALSFLGLGVQPPTPSWGNMLRHAEDAIQSDPGLAFWPGSCILVTVVCVYVLGEALRARFDPRSLSSR